MNVDREMKTVKTDAVDNSLSYSEKTKTKRLEHAEKYIRENILARVINIEVVKHDADYKHYIIAIKLEDCNKFAGRQDKVILHKLKVNCQLSQKIIEDTLDKYLGINDTINIVSPILLEDSWS